VRLVERFVNDRVNGFDMLARSYFGENASKLGMQVDLRRNHARENDSAVLNDGSRRLVAGGFDAKDADGRFFYLIWFLDGSFWHF
jgi:hypothetical protein